jgi:hypothetical protein
MQKVESGEGAGRKVARRLLAAIGVIVWLVFEAVPRKHQGPVLFLVFIAFLVVGLVEVAFGKRATGAGPPEGTEPRLDEGEEESRSSMSSARPIEPR